MKTSPDHIKARMSQRSLPDLLVRKFLTEYGYTHGPVIATAIVEDILATLEQCCPERIPPKTVVWLAVRREWQGRQKGLDVKDLVPVQLTVVTDEELDLLRSPRLRHERKARKRFNQARYARWCFEAYEQGGVLTLLELSMLSGLSHHYIGKLIREYEQEHDVIIPTRGTVHDLGPGVTHKAEVVRRWLRQESPAQIARTLEHSQEAVDRYLADFQKVRLLAQKFPISELPVLSGLSAKLVEEYIALLQEYEPDLPLYADAEAERGPDEVAGPAASEREPGAQPPSRAKSAASLDGGEHRATLKQTPGREPIQRLSVVH
jgi:hypothetical protein